jgi:phosphocarrier protein HPr
VSRAEAEVQISNELGLHLRAASAFAKLAESFGCEVTLAKGDSCVNGKSVIALATLAASQGVLMKITAEGEDADEAVSALVALVEGKFGEAK